MSPSILQSPPAVPLRCDSGLFCLNFAVGEVSYLLSLSRVGMQIGERSDGDGDGDGGVGRGVGVGVGRREASWMEEWTGAEPKPKARRAAIQSAAQSRREVSGRG